MTDDLIPHPGARVKNPGMKREFLKIPEIVDAYSNMICVKFFIPDDNGYIHLLEDVVRNILGVWTSYERTGDDKGARVAKVWRYEVAPTIVLDNCETTINMSGCNSVPIGGVILWTNATIPTGWLECDGSEVSQSTYPDLYALLGSTYGNGHEGTFMIPDLRSRVPVGFRQTASAPLSARAMGASGGAETHTLSVAELPAHSHEVSVRDPSNGFGTGVIALEDNLAGNLNKLTTQTGSNTAHNNMPPFLVFKYIIRALSEDCQVIIEAPPGAKGEKGDKGDKGDTGNQGEQGIPGEQGIQGIPGESPGCNDCPGEDFPTETPGENGADKRCNVAAYLSEVGLPDLLEPVLDSIDEAGAAFALVGILLGIVVALTAGAGAVIVAFAAAAGAAMGELIGINTENVRDQANNAYWLEVKCKIFCVLPPDGIITAGVASAIASEIATIPNKFDVNQVLGVILRSLSEDLRAGWSSVGALYPGFGCNACECEECNFVVEGYDNKTIVFPRPDLGECWYEAQFYDNSQGGTNNANGRYFAVVVITPCAIVEEVNYNANLPANPANQSYRACGSAINTYGSNGQDECVGAITFRSKTNTAGVLFKLGDECG